MKKIMTLFIILMLLPFAYGLTGSGDENRKKDTFSAKNAFSVPDLDCDSDSGIIVAMDISKGQLADDAKDFLGDLIDAGYSVRQIDISTDPQDLECVDVLYVSSLLSNGHLDGTYSSSEINDIHAFVTNGGGLFITSDWGTFSEETEDLMANFDMYVYNNGLSDSDDYDTNSYWPLYEDDNFISGSPIYEGVDGVVFLYGTSFDVDEDSSLVPVMLTDDDETSSLRDVPVVAAGFYEQGCVVGTSDSNWLHTYTDDVDGYNRYDNPRFALNIVDFLLDCDEGDLEIPEFGIIGAIVAISGAGLIIYTRRKL